MTEHKMQFLTDRTAAETDDKCGMRFFWNRKYRGKGIVPVQEPLALMVGREVHEDLATIDEMDDISPLNLQKICDKLTVFLDENSKQDQTKMEILYRRLGWLVAFALYIEPTIREKYENIHIEGEIALDRDPLIVAVTPDRILRDRKEGHYVYREYKSTISANQKWMRSWLYAIQLHIGIAAAQEEYGFPVRFAQIMGLMKGYRSSLDDRLVHPYVWAYYNSKTGDWTHEYTKARGADWEGMPVWEYPGGMVEWVQRCGEDVARSQFPHSPPVFLDERLLNRWVQRRLKRERIVAAVQARCQTDLDHRALHFEQKQGQCQPPFGDPCPYLAACHNAAIEKDPMASGMYEPRQPHHMMEVLDV